MSPPAILIKDPRDRWKNNIDSSTPIFYPLLQVTHIHMAENEDSEIRQEWYVLKSRLNTSILNYSFDCDNPWIHLKPFIK